MIGRNAIEFMHPDDLESARREMRAARSENPTRTSPAVSSTRMAEPYWLSWMGAWSEAGQAALLVGRDMTEAGTPADAARKRELARNIVETALDAFVQMTKMCDPKLEYAGREDLRRPPQGSAGQGPDPPDRVGADRATLRRRGNASSIPDRA